MMVLQYAVHRNLCTDFAELWTSKG